MTETQSWNFWARDDQAAPLEDWRVWLVMAGRGYGKTRMGAEWVRALAAQHAGARFALVGATLNEARAVMVEGESGLLSLPYSERPLWEPSLRRLTWANGAMATLFSAAEPESLRGPQHDFAWADEIAKWPSGIKAWDNLMLGLRLGENPRAMATTTPRPVPLLRRLEIWWTWRGPVGAACRPQCILGQALGRVESGTCALRAEHAHCNGRNLCHIAAAWRLFPLRRWEKMADRRNRTWVWHGTH